ncbi:DUF6538 domain-containing protein [Acidiphilium iwatense]|uniref:DUF6538 domain-containing protein n=1 Tax=Acidiphilium TaxID=522 RepID=UPI0038B26A55
MALCSFVEKRRNRYYFRARLPVDIARAIGRSHVVASLGYAAVHTPPMPYALLKLAEKNA